MIIGDTHIYGVASEVKEIALEDSTDMAYLITLYDGNSRILIEVINGEIHSCKHEQQRRL